MKKSTKATKTMNTVEAQATTPPASATTGSAEAQPAPEPNAELACLTQEIKDDLGQLNGLVKTSATTARTLGQRLLRVKELVQAEKNSWTQWVKDNLAVSSRQVQKYMKLATVWDELLKKGHDPEKFTIDQNLALLRYPGGKIEDIPWESPAKPAQPVVPDAAFRVSSEEQFKDKKLQAHELMESETASFAPDSAAAKFIVGKVTSLARQVRQQAQTVSKGAADGKASDPAVVAIALLNKIRAELSASLVVEVVEAKQEAEVNGAPAAEMSTPHNRLNGHVSALPA